MKTTNIIIVFLTFTFVGYAQTTKLASVSDHYKALQQFSSLPNPARAWLDTINYPPSEYGSSIVYLLVKPYYLTDGQVKRLTESMKFPANSSDQVRHELDYLLALQAKRTADEIK